MSYNQQNPRHSGQSRHGQRPPGSGAREAGNYGSSSSYEASSYNNPSYEPSTYETQRIWDDNREGRQGEGYRDPQNFRGNRDYRTTQEDYRLQQDYEIGEASERGDPWERSGREPFGLQRAQLNQPERNQFRQQDWDQYPQQSSGSQNYRSAQFAGRQQIPGSQTPYGQRSQQNYGSDFGNASRQYAGDEAGFDRGQQWGGNSYAPEQSQFGWDRGNFHQPQGASPGWQNNPSRHSTDYYDADFSGAGGSYADRQNWGFQNQGYQTGGQDYRSPQQSHRGRSPKGYERSDERIREDICERLTHDHRIDASDVTVTVKAGVVTLEGSIGDRNQKYRVEDISDNASGVKDVQNRLNVTRNAQNSTTEQQRADSRTGQQEKQQDELGKSSTQKITRQ